MSQEEQLLHYWSDLSAEQQEIALDFLKNLQHTPIVEPKRSLGQKLRESRQRIVASGVDLLSWDDLDAEVADRRGRAVTQDE